MAIRARSMLPDIGQGRELNQVADHFLTCFCSLGLG
jgi:hypothetical protein